MVLVQKWPFFQLSFVWNTGPENVFFNIVKRKNAFLGYKNTKFKGGKIEIFPKGLTRGLFLGNRGQKNMFYDILKRKNAFLGYKKIQL